MSYIIRLEPYMDGAHAYESQSHRRYPENWNGDGWLPVPPELEANVRKYCPYCELVIENGELVDVIPAEEPEPTITTDDQIDILKSELTSTDYKVIKCAEAQLAGISAPYDIKMLHAERQALRDKINELEASQEVNNNG